MARNTTPPAAPAAPAAPALELVTNSRFELVDNTAEATADRPEVREETVELIGGLSQVNRI
jgi:hypothetical protein